MIRRGKWTGIVCTAAIGVLFLASRTQLQAQPQGDGASPSETGTAGRAGLQDLSKLPDPPASDPSRGSGGILLDGAVPMADRVSTEKNTTVPGAAALSSRAARPPR